MKWEVTGGPGSKACDRKGFLFPGPSESQASRGAGQDAVW